MGIATMAALLYPSLANADCASALGQDRRSLDVQGGVSWLMTPCDARFFTRRPHEELGDALGAVYRGLSEIHRNSSTSATRPVKSKQYCETI